VCVCACACVCFCNSSRFFPNSQGSSLIHSSTLQLRRSRDSRLNWA
jgi:hypothetical protein